MRPVVQHEGNSLEACLASVLDAPLFKIPVFDKTSGLRFWDQAKASLESIGVHAMEFDGSDQSEMLRCPLYIAIGKAHGIDGPTARLDHAVVMGYGKVVWDPLPRPGRPGLRNYSTFMVLTIVDARKLADWFFPKMEVHSTVTPDRFIAGEQPKFVTGTLDNPVRPEHLTPVAQGEMKGTVKFALLSSEHARAVEQAPRDSMGYRTDPQFGDRWKTTLDTQNDVDNEGQRAFPRKDPP